MEVNMQPMLIWMKLLSLFKGLHVFWVLRSHGWCLVNSLTTCQLSLAIVLYQQMYSIPPGCSNQMWVCVSIILITLCCRFKSGWVVTWYYITLASTGKHWIVDFWFSLFWLQTFTRYLERHLSQLLKCFVWDKETCFYCENTLSSNCIYINMIRYLLS